MKKIVSAIAAFLLLTTPILATPGIETNAAVQKKITRSQADQRALRMINYTWTYSAGKNGKLAAQYVPHVMQPSQFKNISSGKMTGIPYNWGGSDSLDSHSASTSWSNFQQAVSKGAYMGNVSLDYTKGLTPGTAGIDCSGFVQSVFNIKGSKLSTNTLFKTYFTKIKVSSIKHMDILDRPGDHVVVFDKWGTLNGVKGAFTYESTPDQAFGGIQGTKKYFLTMTDLNKGYIAGRYKYISETVPAKSTNLKGKYAKVVNVKSVAYLRVKASQSSKIVSKIPKGTTIYLIDYSKGYYKVKYKGKTGWIRGNLVKAVSRK